VSDDGSDASIVERLEKSVRQGDWDAVPGLIRRLEAAPVPSTPAALAERSRRLQSILVAARIGRTGLAVALNRARAAASFANSCQ